MARQGGKHAPEGVQVRRRVAVPLVACLVVFAVLAAIPVFVNTLIGYVPVIAFAFVLLLCFAYLQVLKRSLDFEQVEAQTGCVRGDLLFFKLRVRNRSILPAVRVEALFRICDPSGNSISTAVRAITLPPLQDKVFDFGARFDHIGSYSVGVGQLAIHDPFSIFTSVRESGMLQQVVVGPRMVDIADIEVSDDAVHESKKMLKTVINDGLDYSGVREYVWGDPIKTIHWKLSARELDMYYTRLYETATNPGIAVFADFHAPAYGFDDLLDVYDAVVETAFAVERYASGNGMDSELLFLSEEGEAVRIPGPVGDHASVLQRMPGSVTAGEGQVLDLVTREAASIYAQSNFAVCTANVTDALVRTLATVRTGKRNPILYAIVAPGVQDDERTGLLAPLRHLDALGISYRVISGAEDLGKDGA